MINDLYIKITRGAPGFYLLKRNITTIRTSAENFQVQSYTNLSKLGHVTKNDIFCECGIDLEPASIPISPILAFSRKPSMRVNLGRITY